LKNPKSSLSEFNVHLGRIKKSKDHDNVVKLGLRIKLEGIRSDLVTLNILIDALSHKL